MADKDEDNLFDDIDDETEGGGVATEKDDDNDNDIDAEPDEPGEQDTEDLCRDCTAEAAELGIVIPDNITSCEDWMQHFLTSIKTHKATKAAGGGTAPATAESGESPTEESPMMMSGLRIDKHHDPVTRALGKEREAAIAATRRKRLKRLEESGLFPPAMIADLRSRASVVRLSLLGDKFVAGGTVDAEIKALCQTLENINGLGHGRRLSLLARATEHANPLDAAAKEDEEVAEALTTRSDRNPKK